MFAWLCLFLTVCNASARIENNKDLESEVSKRMRTFTAPRDALLKKQEVVIRNKYSSRSEYLEQKIAQAQKEIKVCSQSFKSIAGATNNLLKEWACARQEAFLALPKYVAIKAERDELEERIQGIEASESYQNRLNEALTAHQRDVREAKANWERRVAESEANRDAGRMWCKNDGCYQYEWYAELSWHNPRAGVRHQFGLIELDEQFAKSCARYDALMQKYYGPFLYEFDLKAALEPLQNRYNALQGEYNELNQQIQKELIAAAETYPINYRELYVGTLQSVLDEHHVDVPVDAPASEADFKAYEWVRDTFS